MVTSAKEISDLAHGIDVHSSGNVGIGVASPSCILHASTGSNGSGLIDVARFENEGTSANDGARIQLTAGSSTSGAGIGCLGDALNSAHLVFHAGGNTERMRLTSSGNVGIGEANPQRSVVVKGANSSTTSIQFQTPATGSAAGDGFGIGYDSNGKGFIWNYEGSDTYIGGATSSTTVTIQGSSGNVGIGTTNPLRQLHVNGGNEANLHLTSASFRSGIMIDKPGTTSIMGSALVLASDESYRLGTASNYHVQMFQDGRTQLMGAGALGVSVDTSGRVGIGAAPNATFGSLLYAQGTPAANKPIISGYSQGNSNNAGFALFNDSGNRGIWTTGSTMRFTRTYEGNSTADVSIDASGNVGIGATTNLTSKLTVNAPAASHTTGYQEDIAQFYTTESSYLGRHYLNMFHDNNNRDSSGHHTVWGMGFGYDGNTRGGIQYDHKGQERLTLWSSYGDIHIKGNSTGSAGLRADQADTDIMVLKGNGNVGIGTTAPAGSLDVAGRFIARENTTTTVTGASSTVHNLTNISKVSGKVNVPFEVYFANTVSNLAVRLYYTAHSLWCAGEVLIGATYSNQMAGGHVRYSFAHHYNGASNYGYHLSNTENVMSTSSHFSLHDHGWDSTESAHYFEFRHLTSTGNTMWVQWQGHGSAYNNAWNGNWYYKHRTY